MPEPSKPCRFPVQSILIALLLILVGVGVGYGLAPTRTVTVEKQVEVVVEKSVTKYVKNPYEDVVIHDRRGRSTAPTSK